MKIDLDMSTIEIKKDILLEKYKYIRTIVDNHTNNQLKILSAYITFYTGFWTFISSTTFKDEKLMYLLLCIFTIVMCILWADQVFRQSRATYLSRETEKEIKKLFNCNFDLEYRIQSFKIKNTFFEKYSAHSYYILILVLFLITELVSLYKLLDLSSLQLSIIVNSIKNNMNYFVVLLVLIMLFAPMMFLYLRLLIDIRKKILEDDDN